MNATTLSHTKPPQSWLNKTGSLIPGLLLAGAGTAQATPAETSSPGGLQCLMTNTECPSGAPVANFTVASTPRTFDRNSGEWKDGDAMFLTHNPA